MSYLFVSPVLDVGAGLRPSDGSLLYFFDQGTSNPKTVYQDFALTTPHDYPVVSDGDGRFPAIYLSGTADVRLNDSGNSLVWGPETIYPPDDSVTGLDAANVNLSDGAGYYTGSNVESALAEVGLQGLRRDRPETMSNNLTLNAELINATLRSFKVKHVAISSVTGTLTIDLTAGNSFSATLTENVTIAITGATSNYNQFTLEITQDSGGGAYTVTQPAGVLTQGGAGYTMSTGNGAIDELTYRTVNAGTNWKLDSGLAYA